MPAVDCKECHLGLFLVPAQYEPVVFRDASASSPRALHEGRHCCAVAGTVTLLSARTDRESARNQATVSELLLACKRHGHLQEAHFDGTIQGLRNAP